MATGGNAATRPMHSERLDDTAPVGRESEAERAAAEYSARRAGGEEPDVELLARDLAPEARAAFRELAQSADLALGSVPRRDQRVLAGRYVLEREIGAGGMGRVFSAHDRELGRPVAVKVLSLAGVGDPEREALLLRESRILASLQHPGIVAVHEAARDGELFFVVMDLVDGVSFADALERVVARAGRADGAPIRGGDALAEAVGAEPSVGRACLLDRASHGRSVARIAAEIARTLEAAHARGVVHRDVKPSNVMVTAGGNPVLLDFGLAGSDQRVDGAITEGLYGTVCYLAPEQARSGRVGADPRTDVYQLGLLLYEGLTLRRAYEGGAISDVLERIGRGEYALPRRLNPAVHPDLEAICCKALEVAPGTRYQTMAELRADLETYLSGDGVPLAVRTDLVRSVARRSRIALRRRPWAFASAAALLFAAATWLLVQGTPPPPVVEGYIASESGSVRSAAGEAQPGERLVVRVSPRSSSQVVYALAERELAGERYVATLQPRVVDRSEEAELPPVEGHALALGGASDLYCQVVEGGFEREGVLVFAAPGPRPVLEAWLARLDAEARDLGTDLVEWDRALELLAGVVAGERSRGLSVPEVPAESRAAFSGAIDRLVETDPTYLPWPDGISVRAIRCAVAAGGSPGGKEE